MKEIFDWIIRNHYWADVLCGSGSTLEHTKLLRDTLPSFLERHGVQSMLDAPCGDHSWMSLVDFGDNFVYIGADIVESMVNDNRKKYPETNFHVMDISQDTIPDVDLIFIRDCLIHHSIKDIWKVLENISKSNVKYAMITSYKAFQSVADITTGDFRPVNMQCGPFNLPAPIDALDDGIPGKIVRTMGLWSRKQIEDAIEKNLH